MKVWFFMNSEVEGDIVGGGRRRGKTDWFKARLSILLA